MKQFHTFFTDKAANGIGTPALVTDFDKFLMSIDTTASSTLAVKFQGSISEALPNFAAAQSDTNQWDYIEVVDLEDGAAIDGDTGITITAGTDHRMLQANVDGLVHINVIVSGYTGGGVTAKLLKVNNNK